MLPSSMRTITVRGVRADQLAALQREAQQRGISMNTLAPQRITQALAAGEAADHAALLALAGPWSQQESDGFTSAIAPLEQVDPELWSDCLRRTD